MDADEPLSSPITDLLVKLYALPSIPASSGQIRRALAPERHLVVDWVKEHFGMPWSSETAVAFGGQPIRCFVATREEALVGFACINTTFLGFFGPFGMREDVRGQGIGSALLLTALHAMREEGYAYAIIGGAKSGSIYEKLLGALPIPGSWPGAYQGLLRHQQTDAEHE